MLWKKSKYQKGNKGNGKEAKVFIEVFMYEMTLI